MTNTHELCQAIRSAGVKRKSLCQVLGITYPTLHRLLNGDKEFTSSQIVTVSRYLNLGTEQTIKIFLSRG